MKRFGMKILGNISSNLIKFKLIPPPLMRENKISVTIRVKNEAEWIGYCLSSFKDFADEIIISDRGSTDNSIEIIKDFMENHPDKQIKFFDRKEDTYLELSNFEIKQTRYRWIMRVDADQVAQTSGKYNIMKLKKRILQLNPNYYYAIYLNHVNLFLDFFHLNKIYQRHREIWLYNYSPDVVCIRKGRYSDVFWIPIYYKYLDFTEPFIYHVNLRTKMRLLERIYWTDWFLKEMNISLEEYIAKRIKEDFLTDSLEEAADINLRKQFEYVKPFDASLYGGYPEVLGALIDNPPYKIIYDENGKLKTRIEPEI